MSSGTRFTRQSLQQFHQPFQQFHQHFRNRHPVIRSFIAGTLLGSCGAAHGLVIDDFSSGEFQGGTFNNFYQAYRAASAGTMAGEQRGTLSNYNDGFAVADGVYRYNSAVQYNAPGVYDETTVPEPGVRLIYGNSPGFAFSALDLDLSDYSGIDVTFPSVTESFSLSLFATTFNGETAYGEVSTLVGASADPVVASLSFAQMNTEGPVDWTNIASLQFNFYANGEPLDLAVDSIDAIQGAIPVPEPAPLALLAAGLVALLLTRAGASRTAQR